MNLFNYIGIAGEYPFTCANGSLKLVTGNTDIEMSIKQILGLERGTLPYNPYFGSDLNKVLFEPSDEVAASLGRTYIVEALRQWEQRIDVIDISSEIKKETVGQQVISVVLFGIKYRVIASNETSTFVFPFYRELEW